MKTAFKFISAILLAFICIFIIGIIVFTKIVNPNDFKNNIDQYVFKKTTRHLVINGDAHWSFFPWLGVDLKDVHLTNPAGFNGTNLANIDEIRIKVRFWPLLKGKVRLGKIVVFNAEINLIKNAQGETNWAEWRTPSSATPPSSQPLSSATPATTTTPATTNTRKTLESVHIAGVNINTSTIHFINQKDNETITLHDFYVNTTPIKLANFFAVVVKFTLQPSQSSKVRIPAYCAGDIDIDVEKQLFQLVNLNIKAYVSRPKLPDVPFALQGNMTLDMTQQTLVFDPITLQLVNVGLNGKLQATQLFQTPNISVTLSTEDTEIEPLITLIHGKPFLKGRLSFDTTLTTSGDTQTDLTQNLNGTGKIIITDGAILGFNFQQMIKQGQMAASKQPDTDTASSLPQTSFSHLSASYVVQQGIVRNDDLALLAGELSATGNGNIDLNNSTMLYTFTAQYSPINNQGQAPFVIPIVISGALSSPTVKPDFSQVIKRLVSDAVEQKIQNLTGQKIKINNQ